MGTQTYGDGVVRETRAVGEVTVTVFGKDTDLRHRILESAREVAIDANGCAAEPPSDQSPSATTITSAERLSVCVYDLASTAWNSPSLLFSTTPSAQEATAYRKASAAAVSGKTARTVISRYGHTASVRIGLHGQDAAGTQTTRWDLMQGAQLIVPVAGTEPGGFVPLSVTKALVAPSAKDLGGIKAYVIGPGSDVAEVAPYFRGILG